jgi:hypothetical protein
MGSYLLFLMLLLDDDDDGHVAVADVVTETMGRK